MKWFDKWFLNKAKWAWQYREDEPEEIATTSASWGSNRPTRANRIASSNDVESDEGLNIVVRNAQGGRIVTFRHYDHKSDRTQHKIYVIPEDNDFEKELGKLITMESMRG
jgi:hypothetical protein